MKIHSSVTDPNGVIHPWVFDFELAFFDQEKFQWVEKTMYDWWWLSIVYTLFYIVAIFIGQQWMIKRKEKFELRTLLITWNAMLTIFSVWGACRCVPEFIYALQHHGFLYSICDASYKNGITGLWTWLFMASKLPETVDTLFIVLRGQKLIFLHWYHHASVLVYCFFSYSMFVSTGRWFVSMNYVVHSIMYGYFALRAARVRVPRFLQKFITILQLVQMVFGCFVNLAALNSKQRGYECATSDINIKLSLLLYASYLILFGHFFYNSYLRKDPSKKSNGKTE
ncbi:unnamed protein product [Rotaria socialis]|uniref:Elongation of very long chain fatty acids protein n=1 Tax=Rotaria socialis TaxID=392032 RepID=A0A817S7D1_9BILA|nr:unnamed protein product [Rotaria socialis]CAF3740034.1 unnamed protein product [Rotaria socialis]CAF4444821.1 unnamed protein product [Rotaria socialis]CAF4547067.1 unnamed protein product [Rotaria socialis]